LLGPGPCLMKKDLPGCGLTKVEKQWAILFIAYLFMIINKHARKSIHCPFYCLIMLAYMSALGYRITVT